MARSAVAVGASAVDIRPQQGFQERFGSTSADIAIGGGSAGCGKSWSLVAEPLRHTGKRGFNAIVFRRLSTELFGGGGIWDEAGRVYPNAGGVPKLHRSEWRFSSEARVEFRHLQHVDDVYSHRSKQYALICYDELTQFEEYQFWYLLSRNRSTCGVKPYIRACTNPDPDSWVRDFIDWWIGGDGLPIPERAGVLRWFIRDGDDLIWADDPEDLIASHGCDPDDPTSVTFIPGKLTDNKILMENDSQYLSRLRALPYVDRMQLLGGNWDIRPAAGLYFRPEYFEIIDAMPPDLKKTIRAWDKAGTVKKVGNDPAWTVGLKMTRTRGGVYVIEDVARFQESPLVVNQRMKAVASHDGKGCGVWVWRDPGQAGLADVEHTRVALDPYVVRAVTAREDKLTYAKPYSAAAEAGAIKLLRGPWNRAYISEHQGFPEGKKKDQVDAGSLAYRQLTHKRKRAHKRKATGHRKAWGWSDADGVDTEH